MSGRASVKSDLGTHSASRPVFRFFFSFLSIISVSVFRSSDLVCFPAAPRRDSPMHSSNSLSQSRSLCRPALLLRCSHSFLSFFLSFFFPTTSPQKLNSCRPLSANSPTLLLGRVVGRRRTVKLANDDNQSHNRGHMEQ